MPLNIQAIRDQFPALSQNAIDGVQPIYFDNPAGTQVPQTVIDAIAEYYIHRNANTGGTFATSKRNDEMQTAVRRKLAAFLNAPSPKEIVIGPNMTTLTFGLSRAIAKTLQPGDEIVLTRMDHDANVNPWLLMAEDNGLVVRWIDVDLTDCTLDMDSFEAALTDRTKLVAIVHASNAVGTINPVKRIVQMAHAAGALTFVDAVQSTPHIPIDVQDLDCDFLACSSYKFFGPHMGILWGKYDLLAELPAYKVRPAKDVPPYRWETGTPNYECFAAIGATLDYIAAVGRDYGSDYAAQYVYYEGEGHDLKRGMAVIAESERDLVEHLIRVLEGIDGVTVYGITDPKRLTERVPTVVFDLKGYTSHQVAEYLATKQIQVWHGNYYAVEIMEQLGFSEEGLLRVGLAHYNTHEEIDRLEVALKELVGK
jgi:cysteine desulfurase family protein (TIGR01976 family)